MSDVVVGGGGSIRPVVTCAVCVVSPPLTKPLATCGGHGAARGQRRKPSPSKPLDGRGRTAVHPVYASMHRGGLSRPPLRGTSCPEPTKLLVVYHGRAP